MELSQEVVRLFAESEQPHFITGMWHLSAMSLDMPDVPEHPNAIPFSGIVTRLDEPSDNPVGGAKGRRILIPKAVAEKALPSFLGMGVNYVPGLTGHDPTRKIGVITDAWIEGNAIHIKGILYGSDFPAVVAEIKAKKGQLGFSYEAAAAVKSWETDPAEVTACYFTGAAILYKDRAAYTTTSLEASASEENIVIQLTQEQLDAAIAAAVSKAVTPLNEQITALQASSEALQANAAVHSKVKPHADALRAAADGLQAAGFGQHPDHGHVKILNRMADKMEAEAVLGKLPHIYRDHDFLSAAADPNAATELADANAKVASLTAQLADANQKLFAAAQSPVRKTDVNLNASKESGGVESIKDMRVRLKAEGKSGREIAQAITLHASTHNLPVE